MKQTIQDTLIYLLRSGPWKKSDLIVAASEKTKTTPQGVYRALRKLRSKDVITTQRKVVSLSLSWIDEQLNTYKKTMKNYEEKARNNTFLKLKPGKSAMFKFHTLQELDTFWVDTFLLAELQTASNVPVYAVIPHDWFAYLRPSTNRAWARRLKSKRHQGIVLTHALPFDRQVSKEREAKELEFVFNQNPLKLDEQKYINIIGSWIFEATIDFKANSLLVNWMKNHSKIAKNDQSELDVLLKLPGNYQLKITNSFKRAKKIIKKIHSYFAFTLIK